MVLGSTEPLTEMSTRKISWGGKSSRCIGLTTLPPSWALKIWSLNLLEPSGPVQACDGTAFYLVLKCSLLCLQQSTTGLYPEPAESSPCHHTYLRPTCISVLLLHLLLCVVRNFFSSCFHIKILNVFFIFPSYLITLMIFDTHLRLRMSGAIPPVPIETLTVWMWRTLCQYL